MSKFINFVTWFLCAAQFSIWATQLSACEVTGFNIIGLEKTNQEWLRDYLELDLKIAQNGEDLEKIRQKIMTSDIFSSATVEFDREYTSNCKINISIKEKLTRIPVVRGVYGGGTPLLILGGYETNAFGKLYAVGGEVRRYGKMAPGAFFFFKSPRAWRGRGLFGGELWLDRRRRAFFDNDGKTYGHVDSESWSAKIQWLYPWLISDAGSWQVGVHSQFTRENPANFLLEKNYLGVHSTSPDGLSIDSAPDLGLVVGPMLALDNLRVDGLNVEGMKVKSLAGHARSKNSSGAFAEGEIFSYALLPNEINLAGRIFLGSTTLKTVGSVYYLGGFDSIRGLPDGIHYGNKIAYGNFEARMIAARYRYAHIQPAIFYDTGSAWMDDANPYSGRETSVGGGVRISIPQIYRLILRIDYGFSIGHTKARGLSIALNQFFQPYKLVF